ncbi:MAG: penicillin-binding protein 2 [Anaerolineaceae bacterium]|nr:penicillin-binding protein 2 [Anaerolineaceae bacterium]
MQAAQTQQDIFNRRLPIVIIGMIVASGYLLLQLVSFQQIAPEVANELRPNYNRNVRLAAARGIIYDHSGQRLAENTVEYRIGISPSLVSDKRRVATQLAAILRLDELETYEKINSDDPWVLLTPRVNAEIGQQVEALNLQALDIEKIPRRSYPQGTLAAQIIGFVGGDLQGYYGVEGYYQDQLAGRIREEVVSDIPFDLPDDQTPDQGGSIYLTLDRDIQYLVESELALAIDETGATGGSYIVMNPRTGDILAMASWPSFDPNAYASVDANIWRNPAISDEYEPGSVMKVLTVAGALDRGAITPDFTYVDQGELAVGGIVVKNWDLRAHGVVDVRGILVDSLNVGAATLSLKMGHEAFYAAMDAFGIGRPTRVNLEGEAPGTMYVPGDPEWSESNLGTNAFGQGVTVTPLQMLVAVSAIANDGLLMQPNLVARVVDGNQVVESQPTFLRRAISPETAHIVTDMMVSVVNENDSLDGSAALPGYSVAGKTGTAEIPSPIGYESNAWIMTFVGFLPADDPQVAILIKLDRPTTGRWASQVVAPRFRRLAERLVVMMEIPPDDVRHALEAQGGVVDG